MEIRIRETDGIKTAAVAGSLDAHTSEQARIQLFQAIVPHSKVIVDLSKCAYISSAGLRVLLLTAKRAKSVSARVAYAAAIEEVADVLEMTGFDRLLDSAATAEEAREKLNGRS